jgi:hypothetical protein
MRDLVTEEMKRQRILEELAELHEWGCWDYVVNVGGAIALIMLVFSIGYLFRMFVESRKYKKDHTNLSRTILDRYKKKKNKKQKF